jgi:hypothetical protein
MSLRSAIQALLPWLLTLCVGSLGPAALASVPRSLTVNTQEEERGSGESDGICSLATSVLRPAKPLNGPEGARRAQNWSNAWLDGLLAREMPAPKSTLCSLQVRIQV